MVLPSAVGMMPATLRAAINAGPPSPEIPEPSPAMVEEVPSGKALCIDELDPMYRLPELYAMAELPNVENVLIVPPELTTRILLLLESAMYKLPLPKTSALPSKASFRGL